MKARSLSKMMAGTQSSHGISNGGQRGGLDPLRRVPPFKYTTLETRKALVGHVYPYADYLLQCVQGINLDEYDFEGLVTYLDYTKDEENGVVSQAIFKCEEKDRKNGTVTRAKPSICYVGGTVYELLNMKYGSSVDLYRYCDATGDVDVTLNPPFLESFDDNGESRLGYMIPFQIDGQMNEFYRDFGTWAYSSFFDNLINQRNILSKIPGILDFDINEYNDIPMENKVPELGYMAERVPGTNFWVVAFLSSNMYKIQLVCKVEESGVVEIDHIIELIIPTPDTIESEFNLNPEYYRPKDSQTITINGSKYKVQIMVGLIHDNIQAYKERKISIIKAYRDQHKAYNHIARLLYLYELVYQNPREFDLIQFPSILNIGMFKLVDPYYYKIIDGEFYKFQLSVRYLLNAYISIVKKNFAYQSNKTNPKTKVNGANYFIINDRDEEEMRRIHDEFLERLFNNERFPNDTLTFLEEHVARGKKRKTHKKSRKSNKSTKKHNMKRRKTRKHN
jgi:hypothetical protein